MSFEDRLEILATNIALLTGAVATLAESINGSYERGKFIYAGQPPAEGPLPTQSNTAPPPADKPQPVKTEASDKPKPVEYDADLVSAKVALNRTAVVELLSRYGAKKGSQVKAEDVPAFMAELAKIEAA